MSRNVKWVSPVRHVHTLLAQNRHCYQEIGGDVGRIQEKSPFVSGARDGSIVAATCCSHYSMHCVRMIRCKADLLELCQCTDDANKYTISACTMDERNSSTQDTLRVPVLETHLSELCTLKR
jgi:hypothetical protein